MAGILISPRVEQKIIGRRAAWKLKNGSPNFKDILRQRCRSRIKERRAQFIAQSRGLEDIAEVQQTLTDLLRDEYNKFVNEIESDFVELNWDEDLEVPKDNLLEEELLMKQVDLLLGDESLEKLFDEANEVVCPLCLKGSLKKVPAENVLKCGACSTQVSGCSTLVEIRQLISRCLDVHSASGCCHNINFFINSEEGTSYLYALCSDCSYFDIVG